MGWVTEVGNQVARGVNYGVSSFNAPNYFNWWILPFVITSVLVGILCVWGFWNMNTVRKCDKIDPNRPEKEPACRDVPFQWWVRILLIILITSISASIVAAGVYKMAVYAHNPKMAAGIETTRYIRNAWNNK